MSDWNPTLYLKFESDRNKPIMDLLSHIDLQSPERIVDIGCGPGNSTSLLAKRWPTAKIIGLDSSKTMLEAAKKSHPGLTWVEFDATQDMTPLGSFDLMFSNASLHWMPDQTRLIPAFFRLLRPGGVLAVQVPHNADSPLQKATWDLAKSEKWRGRFTETKTYSYHSPGFYYDILSTLPGAFEIWTTRHHPVLGAHEDIIAWYESTGFRPYLDQLNAAGQGEFLADMLAAVRRAYTPRQDGKILFDFERLYFTLKNDGD